MNEHIAHAFLHPTRLALVLSLAAVLCGCGEIREVFIPSDETDTGEPAATTTSASVDDTGTNDETDTNDRDLDTMDDGGSTTAPPLPEPASVCADRSLSIPDDGTPVELAISIPDPGLYFDPSIGLRIVHPRVADLSVELQAPGGLLVRLLDGPACEGPGVDAFFRDDAAIVGNELCSPDVSVITGVVAPLDPLAPLLAVPGPWVLRVTDSSPGHVGTLDNWCVIANPFESP